MADLTPTFDGMRTSLPPPFTHTDELRMGLLLLCSLTLCNLALTGRLAVPNLG